MSFHETFDREPDAATGSNRSFGWVMAGAFGLIGAVPLLSGRAPRLWALAVALAFAAAAAVAPAALAPLNRAWAALGRALNRVVSPLVMGLLFALVVVPTALALRLAGKDPLRLARDPAASTYWQDRTPPGPAPGSLTQQF